MQTAFQIRLNVLASSTLLLTALLTVPTIAADDTWQIHGQVVDEQGKPVEDFERPNKRVRTICPM